MHVVYDWGRSVQEPHNEQLPERCSSMSPVRFVLLCFVLTSAETTALAQAATRPCGPMSQRTDNPGSACPTAEEQMGELLQNLNLGATEHHLTGKERDTESGNGLDCIYANDAGNDVESIDHHSNAAECGDPENGGTWVPGHVREDHVVYNSKTGQFQAASYDGKNVDYATFGAGAQTDANGNCSRGCSGYGFASADAAWLSSMIVGGTLDQMMTFMVNQDIGIHGIFGPSDPGTVMQILSGPLAFWKDRWAGPDGMRTPSGQGDWAAIAHDYNCDTNHVTVNTYFNPFISRATADTFIQSNNRLIRNAGGFQGAKMGLFFGVVNALQWVAHGF